MDFRKVLTCIILALILLVSSFVFYYTGREEGSKTEQETITWVVGYGYHYSVAIIMKHLELFEKYSNDKYTLEVIILKGPAVSEAIISDSAQFGQRSAPAILKDIDNGAPFKMLLSVGKKDHELWTNNPDIKTLEDITLDHIISLSNPNSIQEMGMKMAFEKIDKQLEESVQVVYLKHSDSYQAMITNQIDLDYTGSPYISRYAREPDKYTYLGCNTDFYGMELPASMIYLKTDFANNHPNIVSIAISAWCEAINWINNNEEETSIIVSKFFNEPTETAYQDFKDSKIIFKSTIGLSALEVLSEKLYEADILSRKYTLDEVLFNVSLGL